MVHLRASSPVTSCLAAEHCGSGPVLPAAGLCLLAGCQAQPCGYFRQVWGLYGANGRHLLIQARRVCSGAVHSDWKSIYALHS